MEWCLRLILWSFLVVSCELLVISFFGLANCKLWLYNKCSEGKYPTSNIIISL